MLRARQVQNQLLRHHPARFFQGYTALSIACQAGNLDLARCLISQGADVGATTARDLSVVHLAAEVGDSALIGMLLDVGVRLLWGDLDAITLALRAVSSLFLMLLLFRRIRSLSEHAHGGWLISREARVMIRLRQTGGGDKLSMSRCFFVTLLNEPQSHETQRANSRLSTKMRRALRSRAALPLRYPPPHTHTHPGTRWVHFKENAAAPSCWVHVINRLDGLVSGASINARIPPPTPLPLIYILWA